MKAFLLIAILFAMSTLTFAQCEKCTKYINDIITVASLDVQTQTSNYTKAVFKAKHNYAEEDLKVICDDIMKSKTALTWVKNRDGNYEKEYQVDGKKLLVTIYWRDEFVYFEY